MLLFITFSQTIICTQNQFFIQISRTTRFLVFFTIIVFAFDRRQNQFWHFPLWIQTCTHSMLFSFCGGGTPYSISRYHDVNGQKEKWINDLDAKIHDDKSHTVGRRLLTLLSFELMPPNVERWKTSAPSVACACEITVSICNTGISRTVQDKTTPIEDEIAFKKKMKKLIQKQGM